MTEEGGREGGRVGSKSCDAEEGMEGIAANALTDVVAVIHSLIEIGMVKRQPQCSGTATPQMQSCSMQ